MISVVPTYTVVVVFNKGVRMKTILLISSIFFIPMAFAQDGMGEATNLSVAADANWNCSKLLMTKNIDELIEYTEPKVKKNGKKVERHLCKIPRCITGKHCRKPCEMMGMLKRIHARTDLPEDYLYSLLWTEIPGTKELSDNEFLKQLKDMTINFTKVYRKVKNFKMEPSPGQKWDDERTFNATVCSLYGSEMLCLENKDKEILDEKIITASEIYAQKPWLALRSKKGCDAKEEKIKE